MATSIRLIQRYVWLVDVIRQAGRLTFDEINGRWLDNTTLNPEHESQIPERTFHRHRDAIADLFGIDILCDRTDGNTYYIGNMGALEGSSFTSWLFNGLSIKNQLADNDELKQRIVFEKSLGGMEYMSTIVDAISNQQRLIICYCRFNQDKERVYEVEPYLLKQSRQRWYLLAKTKDDGLTVFGLDRIRSLEKVQRAFVWDESLDAVHYFDQVIGTNVDDEYDCETVKIRVYGHQRAYFESLPMHESQTLVEAMGDYSDYTMRIRPEYEFIHEVLRYGGDVEVISPRWVREEIAWQLENARKRYDNS